MFRYFLYAAWYAAWKAGLKAGIVAILMVVPVNHVYAQEQAKNVKPSTQKCVKSSDIEAAAAEKVSDNLILSITKEASTQAVAKEYEDNLKEEGKTICPEKKSQKPTPIDKD
jgi:hypothetical protein